MAKKNKSYMKTVMILTVVIMLTFGVIIFSLTSQPHYTWFTEKRKEMMEKKFSITVTENIELREYKMSKLKKPDSRPEFEYRLCLETDNFEKFMIENVDSMMIIEKYDNMNFTYRNTDNQVVYAEVCKNNDKENYSITLVIVDL